MELTYKWSITGLYGKDYTDPELKDAVKVIHWRCAGVLDANESISQSRYGFVILDDATSDGFIEYSAVTEQDVLNWLFTKIDKNQIEQEIYQSMSNADELNALGALSPLYMSWQQQVAPPVPPRPDVPPFTPIEEIAAEPTNPPA